MSDDKILDNNSISTTEDAFDSFQADSMYEEEDYITLSDIVPPQPEVPDLSSELIEIPYEYEVVLSTSQSDTQQEGVSTEDVNINLENGLVEVPNTAQSSSSTQNKYKNDPIQSNDSENSSNSLVPSRKRGGRRKKQVESGTSDEQAIQDSVLSTTVDKNGTESKNDMSIETTAYPRRTRRERILNTAKYPLVSEEALTPSTSTRKKAGRPKKVTEQYQPSLEPDSTNTENNLQNNLNNLESHVKPDSSSKRGAVNRGKGASKRGRSARTRETISENDIEPNKSTNNDNLPIDHEKEAIMPIKTNKRGRNKKISPDIPMPDLKENENLSFMDSSSQNEASYINETELQSQNNINAEIKIDITKPKSGRKKKSVANVNVVQESSIQEDVNVEDDDDADNLSLSKLKESFDETANLDNNVDMTHIDNVEKAEKNSEMPVLADFENNIDKVVTEVIGSDQLNLIPDKIDESLLIEDTSKRPVRRKVKKTFKFDEDSEEEDPFANVELSEDDGEPKSKKKGRYYSDDEYIPGSKRGKHVSSSSDSDIEFDEDDLLGRKQKRKQTSKISDSPKKKGRKSLAENDKDLSILSLYDSDKHDDVKDLEECVTPSYIVADDKLSMKPPAEAWANSNEFENFIAHKIQGTNLKIKKVTSKSQSKSTSIEIPVIDQNEQKKYIEISTQTNSNPMTSTEMQTSVPYDIPMTTKIALTQEQSEKACEFLNSVVKTTSELGQLMKEKSEDFMNKKINTNNVTDTFKMDYCVRKSFLLFKLAKHNLMQMEEDLANQYEEFLKNNDLSSCRNPIKTIVPTPKVDNDSDCEIVEVKDEPSTSKNSNKDKCKFNPKTVFLNKELSIKIAKKPTADKKLEIKGRHTVWINDSVMVKKVKPTQSFLAQDSRNKKPPDCVYVTEKMVSDFFEDYNRQKALTVCAPFINTQCTTLRQEYICNYFVKYEDLGVADSTRDNEHSMNSNDNASASVGQYNETHIQNKDNQNNNPKSLISLSTQAISSYLDIKEELISYENAEKKQPLSLFRLCYKCICLGLKNDKTVKPSLHKIELNENDTMFGNIPSLNTLYCESEDNTVCCNPPVVTQSNQKLFSDFNMHRNAIKTLSSLCLDLIRMFFVDTRYVCKDNDNIDIFTQTVPLEPFQVDSHIPKSLKFVAFEKVKDVMFDTFPQIASTESLQIDFRSPKPLKYITYEKVKNIMSEARSILSSAHTNVQQLSEDFAKESPIRTMKVESFHNLQEINEFNEDDDYVYDPLDDIHSNQGDDENEWASQVLMQELRSCVGNPTNEYENININDTETSPIATTERDFDTSYNILNSDQCQLETHEDGPQPESVLLPPNIKLEPLDDVPENQVDPTIIKTEPIHGYDGMTIIPESIVTKSEMLENLVDPVAAIEPISAICDRDSFENFARNNKMLYASQECGEINDIFSQSLLRIKRQHEPDNDAENDMHMSLLIPHTYEPLQIDNVKDTLMESSSDDGKEGDATKKTNKKKLEKKARGRPRKDQKSKDEKNANTKDPATTSKESNVTTKEIPQCSNEVAYLTRRMREKIRQEEKKIESSDSESENMQLSSRSDKKHGNHTEATLHSKKAIEGEIQCNNVDSTEQIFDEKDKMKQFTGFSAVDQNEITNYQKYMKFVYDKIMPKHLESPPNELSESNEMPQCSRSISPVIKSDQPVELLECEPTFDYEQLEKGQQVRKGKAKKKQNKKEVENIKKAALEDISKNNKIEVKNIDDVVPPNQAKKDNISEFTERNGWHCYAFQNTDKKLNGYCYIPLEKLPESFVNTYFEYNDITNRDKNDEEVDRLTNLQSLKRPTGLKEGKIKSQTKETFSSVSLAEGITPELNLMNVSRSPSPVWSDRAELTPSEDEGNVEDEQPPPVPVSSTENKMAKNSLMDDHNSDSDGGTAKESEEPRDKKPTIHVEGKHQPGPKSRTMTGNVPKSKATSEAISAESLMLTADKMMNKELTLLHAPINLKPEPMDTSGTMVTPKDELKESAKDVTKESPKDDSKRKRSSRNSSSKNRLNLEDDSSSEEEKQWVSTKEKLLKRMGKKEGASVDDAKRAKLVSEFIERRGGAKRRTVTGSRRSKKKFLEKQKQLRVLSKELLGESTGGHRGAPGLLFKGRRNIRKVIDKKSLARSTVIANMEEFERKRRLNSKQTMLRELHGCEEGVNVLVINDEVCLEYDFEEHRPIVTVHPFFTRVMKAHQYEGVKFMWDACFESLSYIEAGHGGGGCILAHCMGLGKTLQVLALLHTVLTHPRVGMQRVLVCCPLSTVLNWVDEIHKWIGPVTDQIKVFELSKLKKTYERAYQLDDWYNGGGIFIIGYELFRSLTTLDPLIDDVRQTIINKIRTALLDPGPDIIICDEGHLLKNDCSVLAVAMSRVVTKRRIVLTGTPMQNNLREYYCMVNFVKPNLLGTYSEYSNRFENPIMNGQHRDSQLQDINLMKTRTHILHKILEGCLQRQEASVLYPYLPKKHEYTVFIPLTKCQWDLYKHYVHHYTKKSKHSILKDFHILQKIWSHPQVLHNFQMKSREETKKKEMKAEKLEDDLALEDKEDLKPLDTEVWWMEYVADGQMLNTLDSSNKFVAVFRILDECVALGDKVLIFSTSLFCLDVLEYFLRLMKSWNLGQEYYRLDGSVPPEVRQKWCREFNAENNNTTKLFLISTRAGSLGLNLTAANRVIILDTSWNPAHDIQSIFRVYRFGQKKDCYIYRLVAMGTMEQKIYERSVTKQAVACRVVDEQQIDRHYNMAELTELYRFDEHGSSVACGVAAGVSDLALLRVARDMAGAVHAVHEHDSLLRGSEPALPKSERDAAWMQFQEEHANKQKQNDYDANQAALALKRSQERQQMAEALKQSQIAKIKTEEGPVHESSLLQAPAILTQKPQTRRGRKKIVKCRIPIQTEGSTQSGQKINVVNQDQLVQQISNLLVRHNFTKSGYNTRQIADLVANVKKMVQYGQPLDLRELDNDLSASIAELIKRHRAPAFAPEENVPLTAVEPQAQPPRIQVIKPSKTWMQNLPPEEESGTVETRRRRRAAIAAEKSFGIDDNSQDSQAGTSHEPEVNETISIDDDEWRDSGADSPEPPPGPKKIPGPKPGPKSKTKQATPDLVKEACSIVLSDDEVEKLVDVKPVISGSEPEKVTLHTSLLTNQNFIKIVAHTYQSGNPMLDEDAATLAAKYSTLKALNEAQASNKPIDSGPIYDIAVQVLGKEVLRKLHLPNPKILSSENDTVPQMLRELDQQYPTEKDNSKKKIESTSSKPSLKDGKKKVGPKSRVAKRVDEAPDTSEAVPVDLVRSVCEGATECILPDGEVQCEAAPVPAARPVSAVRLVPAARARPAGVTLPVRVSAGPAPAPAPVKATAPTRLLLGSKPDSKPPVKLRGVLLKRALLSEPSPTRTDAPVAAAASPARQTVICLDSDDEDIPVAPAPAPPPTRPRILMKIQNVHPTPGAAGSGPVPVALTGPDCQPVPLALSTCTDRASVAAPGARTVPHTPMTGPDARPVPVSTVGSGARPVPVIRPSAGPVLMSMSGPVPVSMTSPGARPVSLIRPCAGPVPISMSGPVPISMSGPVPISMSGPVPISMSGPVPISMSGPVPISMSGPVPISMSGPMPISMSGPVPVSMSGLGARSVSVTGPNASPVPISMSGPVPVSMTSPGARPVPVSLTAPGHETVPIDSSQRAMPVVSGGRIMLSNGDGSFTQVMLQGGAAGSGPVFQPATQSPGAPQLAGEPINFFIVPMSQNQQGIPPQANQLTVIPSTQVPESIRQQVLSGALGPGQVLRMPSPAAPPGAPQPLHAYRAPAASATSVPAADDIQVIDDEEPPPPAPPPAPVRHPAPVRLPAPSTSFATTTSLPTTSTKFASNPVSLLNCGPAIAPKPARPAAAPARASPPECSARRPLRRVSTSSSDSEGSGTDASDPLSILRNVVHIQAPDKPKTLPPQRYKTPAAKLAKSTKYKETSEKKRANEALEKRRNEITQKLGQILENVKRKVMEGESIDGAPSKSVLKKKPAQTGKKPAPKMKESIDLCDLDFATKKSKEISLLENELDKAGKPSKSGPKRSTSLLKPNSTYKSESSTLSGTTKNIVLDGKSKTLTKLSLVDLTGNKSIQVTDVKKITASKLKSQQKPPAKRPAPIDSSSHKKKKTELMTLKDFDIDDIDDIIELD